MACSILSIALNGAGPRVKGFIVGTAWSKDVDRMSLYAGRVTVIVAMAESL